MRPAGRNHSNEARWGPALITERLEEASDVLARLPPERIGAWHSCWPRVIAPAPATGGSEQRPRPPAPSPEATDRMDEVLGWLAWLEPDERRLVWLRAEGVAWKRISRRFGIGRTTAWQRWTMALLKIATRLNAMGEQNRPSNKLLNKSARSMVETP